MSSSTTSTTTNLSSSCRRIAVNLFLALCVLNAARDYLTKVVFPPLLPYYDRLLDDVANAEVGDDNIAWQEEDNDDGNSNNDYDSGEYNNNKKYNNDVLESYSSAMTTTPNNNDDDDDVNTPGKGVAMCAIQKWATAYIDEWVNYHHSIGFTHFMIYDNSDDYELENWRRRRRASTSTSTARHRNNDHNGDDGNNQNRPTVVVTHFPGKSKQPAAYQNCTATLRERYSHSIEFAAFFDLDEFLVLKKHSTVRELLRDHCPPGQCGALTVNWYRFGPSGETAYAPLPLLKRFVYRNPEVRPQVKTIARINSITGKPASPHCFPLMPGRGMDVYDTNGLSNRCPKNWNGTADVAVLHHVWTKSRSEWNKRCTRGRAGTAVASHCDEPIPAHKRFTVFDDSAWQILKRNVPAYRWYDDNERIVFGRTSNSGGGSSRTPTTPRTTTMIEQQQQSGDGRSTGTTSRSSSIVGTTTSSNHHNVPSTTTTASSSLSLGSRNNNQKNKMSNTKRRRRRRRRTKEEDR